MNVQINHFPKLTQDRIMCMNVTKLLCTSVSSNLLCTETAKEDHQHSNKNVKDSRIQ